MARYTNDIDSGWLFKQAIRLFNNCARNWDDDVQDSDFFVLFGEQFGTSEAEAIRYAEKYCGVDEHARWAHIRYYCEQDELEERPTGRPVKKMLQSSIEELIQNIWNRKKLREKCRKMVAAWSHVLQRRVSKQRCTGTDVMERRIDHLADLMRLSDLERDLLIFATVRELTAFDDYPVSPRRINPLVFAAMATDHPCSEVEAALGESGTLSKYGVLSACGKFQSDFMDSGSNPYFRYLRTGDADVLSGELYRRAMLEETLPWNYYGKLADEHGARLKRLIQSANGRRGVNILFYGAPGTGKTSFAKTLAKELGLDLYEILQGDQHHHHELVKSRMIGIRLCGNRMSAGRSLMMVDEADKLLATLASSSLGFGGESSEKGVINSILDETKLPTIWICNARPNVMDKSVLRRFDYSIQFNELNTKQRRQIWRNSVEKLGLGDQIGEDLICRLTDRYRTSAGGIAMVLENVKRMQKAGEDIEELIDGLMQQHCKLVGAPTGNRECLTPVTDYSLDGLNITGDIALPRIVEAVRKFRATQDDGCDPDRPRMNLLLWGPPGTGKTEFVKYLGGKLRSEVHVKMGSDILSMYVGETERLISDAFRQAEAENAILFFDEIDGLVQDRTGARRRWEVTQVNELLNQMENFKGVMVAATNFMENLDQAILRRFTFKLQFDYLDKAGKKLFFERMFKTQLVDEEERRLAVIPNLTPGDFRTVRQKSFYLDGGITNAQRLSELETESSLKKVTQHAPRHFGF